MVSRVGIFDTVQKVWSMLLASSYLSFLSHMNMNIGCISSCMLHAQCPEPRGEVVCLGAGRGEE